MPTGATAPFSQHTPGATPVNQADRADRADRASLRRSRMFHPPTCATADHRYPARPRPPRPRPTTYLPTDHLLLAQPPLSGAAPTTHAPHRPPICPWTTNVRPSHVHTVLHRPLMCETTICCSPDHGIRANLAVEGATRGRSAFWWSVSVLVVGHGPQFRVFPRLHRPPVPPPTTYLSSDHRYSAKSHPYRSPPTTYVRDDHLSLARPRHSRESGGRRSNTRSVSVLVVGERSRGRPRASIPGLPPPAPTTCATANRSCPTDHRRHRRPPVVRPLMPQRRSAPTT